MNKSILNRLDMGGKSEKPRKSAAVEKISTKDMAIIGIALRFPKADDRWTYWENLASGVSCVGELPFERRQLIEHAIDEDSPQFMTAGFLDDISSFDYSYFNIPPNEAALMDPNQRIYLQTVYQAIEDAGYGGGRLRGTRTGVYVGFRNDDVNDYKTLVNLSKFWSDGSAVPGNLASVLASRISYMLNLKGPSMCIDTACSSAFVAIHQACQAIRSGDCSMAIVGAVQVKIFPLDDGNILGVETSDGRVKAFDQYSDGTVWGEGAASIVIKPLYQAVQDNDQVYAVIKGSAVNQDGASVGITAPNAASQSDAITRAWQSAQIDPETITYIETHGTGTALGDVVELDGIRDAFAQHTRKTQFCSVGSVKTNLGHLDSVAGMAGLIKAIEAMRRQELPPSLNFSYPNSKINFPDSPIYLNTRRRKWKSSGGPLRCGISAFGLSGTNAHIILEQAPPARPQRTTQAESQLLCLSANSLTALQAMAGNLAGYLEKEHTVPLSDICYSANTGRGLHRHRAAFRIASRERAGELLGIFAAVGPDDLQNDCVQYGFHKLVAEKTGNPNCRELTHAQLEDLNRQVKACLNDNSASAVAEIGRLFAEGAEIDWDSFYRGTTCRRVSLPTYPFDKTKCWLSVERAPSKAEHGEEHPSLYQLEWNECRKLSDAGKPHRAGELLLFCRDNGEAGAVAKQLKEGGVRLIRVTFDADYCTSGDAQYKINGSDEDCIRLANELEGRDISRVVFLASGRPGQELAEAEYPAAFQETVYPMFRFLKAYAQTAQNKGSLSVVAAARNVEQVTGEEDEYNPQWAPLFGMCRAMEKEEDCYLADCIDYDASVTPEMLCREILQAGGGVSAAYRNGTRYERCLHPFEQSAQKREPEPLSSDGIYLLSGGIGGMGMELARRLSAECNISVALTGRSALPDRDTWDEVIENSTEPRLVQKLQSLRNLETRCANVEYEAVDTAHYDKMKCYIDRLRSQYGRINGVIHCAGIGSGETLREKPDASMMETIRTKAQGAVVLDQLTRQDNPDFFYLCSSISSVFPSMALCDYVAANSFLDSYSAYRTGCGYPTTAIQWSTWKETGMAVDHGFAVDTIFEAMPTADALDCFDQIRTSGSGRLIAGKLNRKQGHILKRSGIALSNSILGWLDSNTQRPDAPAPAQITVSASVEGSRATHVLTEICKEILGYESIDIYDNFFELGADSLMLKKICSRVEDVYPGCLTITDLFEKTSISQLAAHLEGTENSPDHTGSIQKTGTPNRKTDDAVAVIGIGLKVPNADDPEQFWDIIRSGCDCISQLSPHRRKDAEDYFRTVGMPLEDVEFLKGAYLDHIDQFDHAFFKISPGEAKTMDPGQKLFLSTAYSAIEDAGYGGRIRGSNTGVYVGTTANHWNSYSKVLADVDTRLFTSTITGSSLAVIAGRVSYLFDLKGPSMVLDTACSSSLVAVDTACNALRDGKCDMAIAGGVRLSVLPVELRFGYKMGIESSDGITRTFDRNSGGTGFGEGVAAVMLKPLSKALEDKDSIYAVIRGSASNQDGNSAGLTAPNPAAQEQLIRQAWENAGVDPSAISYIEAHGTGTSLGDPIEIQGISQAFSAYTDNKNFCAVSSLKSNFGHMLEAAGIVGLIKASMSLYHKEIPASMHFENPNQDIAFSQSAVYVNTRHRAWEDHGSGRYCGVSAFGLSGTNCHIVLEEAPQTVSEVREESGRHLFTLSAPSQEGLLQTLRRYCSRSEQFREELISDICFTANSCRAQYSHRLGIIAENTGDLIRKLELAAEGNLECRYPWYSCGEGEAVKTADQKQKQAILSNRQELSDQAARLLIDREESGDWLEQLSELYVKGAEIDWDAYYSTTGASQVRLPTYAFTGSRNWIDFPKSSIPATEKQGYYNIRWLPDDAYQIREEQPDTIFVFAGNSPFSLSCTEQFQGQPSRLVVVTPGEHYKDLGDDRYQIGSSEEDYRKLLRVADTTKPIGLLHLWTLEQDEGSSIEKQLDEGAYSLVNFVKAHMEAAGQKPLTILLVSGPVSPVTGEEKHLYPEPASLLGIGRILPQEYPNISCRFLDIDDCVTPEMVSAEFGRGSGYYSYAYRGGQRYTEVFSTDRVTDYPEREFSISGEGAYLITGGLQGIGKETAKLFASQGNVNLALIGQTSLPPRTEWKKLTEEDGLAVLERIRTIQELESAGASVSYYQADVSDYNRMREVVDEIRTAYQSIRGVVHSAGIPGENLLVMKSQEQIRRVMDTKIRGAWNLDRLTETDPLDFFLLYSSITTAFAMPGNGDYVAANSYLDAMSHARNLRGKRTVTIDWVTWKETGMGVRYGINHDGVFRAIETGRAIDSLEQVLGRCCPRIIVGEMDPASPEIGELQNFHIRLSDQIALTIQNAASAAKPGYMEPEPCAVALKGGEGYSQTDELLAGMFGQVLGYNSVDIYDSFFELGGDSITLGRLFALIDEQFPQKLRLVDLFEYNSVSQLSALLNEEEAEEEPQPEPDDGQMMDDLLDLLDSVTSGEKTIDEIVLDIGQE